MRRQPADSIRARGMHIPQPKAGYMAAIFTCQVNTKETAVQTGERPYMVRSFGLNDVGYCLLMFFRHVRCSMFVHPCPSALNKVAQKSRTDYCPRPLLRRADAFAAPL